MGPAMLTIDALSVVRHAGGALAAIVSAPTDPAPNDKDVKAGWTAFLVFLGLIAVVVFLCFSFVKQMRKVERARRAGVYGEDAAGADATSDAEQHPAP